MAIIYGTNSSENIYGTPYEDIIYGYAGNDKLIGRAGYNDYWGGAGYDWFVMSARTMTSGFSNDYVHDFQFNVDRIDVSAWGVSDFSQLKALLTYNLDGDATLNAFYGGQSHVLTLGGISMGQLVASDFVFSTAGAKSETGTAYSDVLFGSRYGDVLKGAGGNDTLLAGEGNDTLVGGTGADRLDGGAGIDTASYAGAASTNASTGAGLVVDLATPSANTGEARGDAFVSIERVTGSSFSDSLRGNESANLLNGGSGNDLLYGRGGNDTLLGGDGFDRLWGGSGTDRLEGGAGGDDLIGGLGRDILIGGSGYDAFIFTSVADSANGSSRDLISDFVEDIDWIDFSQIDARPDVAGNQDFVFKGAAAFTAPGQINYYHSGGNTVVSGNTDFDSTPEFQVELTGIHYLVADDFVGLV